MGDFTLTQSLVILGVTSALIIALAWGLSHLDGRIGKNPDDDSSRKNRDPQ